MNPLGRLPALIALDLRQRWSGGILAWGWALVQPLAQIAIFAVVFGSILIPRGGKFADPRVYVVYLCLGFFPWLAVSEGLSRACGSLAEGAALLRRAPMPLALFPIKAVLASWCLCGIALALVVAVAPFLGCEPRWIWVLLPLPLLSMMFVAVGLGMALAPMAVLIRDVGQFLALALPLLLWTAPVIYVPDVLPSWAQRIQVFHPFVPALHAIHALVVDADLPSRRVVALLALYPVLSMAIGWLTLCHFEDDVRDSL